MKRIQIDNPIGLRTLKTAVSVVLAMLIVDGFGASSSKLIFAMLGAMAAVQPTFKDSLESCLTQIIGVFFGAAVGLLLRLLSLSQFASAGIGIILVIVLYNTFHLRFSPSLPCFIVVMLCTSEEIQPWSYALGRIWDTAIGLSVGMAVNMLVFPYDNRRQMRMLAKSIESDLIDYLEDLFDGDDILPDTYAIFQKCDTLRLQLRQFSNQTLLLRLRKSKRDLLSLQTCAKNAHDLAAQIEILNKIGKPGRLSDENRQKLMECGANIIDQRELTEPTELDIITNYHLRQILLLRQEILSAL